jgi:hypothetical protein
MDELRAEVDRVFSDLEKAVKHHQDKIRVISEAIQKKIEEDTRQMQLLGTRLRNFADTVNDAHDAFFTPDKDHDERH